LAVDPRCEDLSTPDVIRHRVYVDVIHFPTGMKIGTGLGEASSAESKYQWRAAVCDQEWNATPEDRRREKWKKGHPPYSIKQVRADMDDVANTVLKMAKKRAQIDAVLTATAASDVFSQDLEDLRDAGLDPQSTETQKTDAGQQPQQELKRRETAATDPGAEKRAAAAAQYGAKTITEDQGKRFWAAAIKRTNDYKAIMDYLKQVHGVTNKSQILMARYDEAMKWAETGVVED